MKHQPKPSLSLPLPPSFQGTVNADRSVEAPADVLFWCKESDIEPCFEAAYDAPDPNRVIAPDEKEQQVGDYLQFIFHANTEEEKMMFQLRWL